MQVNVEDLKQCVDPEDQDSHNFTFSSGKKNEVGCENRLPETFESALKRIPLEGSSNSKNSKLRQSRSDSKVKSNSKGLNSNYLQKRGDIFADTSCSELDINKLNI